MYPTFPSPKFKVITASANPFTYTGMQAPSSRAIYVSAAGNVTVKNDNDEAVVIPFADNTILPICTRYMTAYSGAGTVVALF